MLQARNLGRNENIEGEGNYIQDHWSYRNRQLLHVLQTIFDWRAARKGRSVQVIGGSGSESCCGFTTRISQKIAKKQKKGEGGGGVVFGDQSSSLLAKQPTKMLPVPFC